MLGPITTAAISDISTSEVIINGDLIAFTLLRLCKGFVGHNQLNVIRTTEHSEWALLPDSELMLL